MTTLIARNGKIEEVKNVKEIKETAFDWVFIKEDGSVEKFSKFSVDIL